MVGTGGITASTPVLAASPAPRLYCTALVEIQNHSFKKQCGGTRDLELERKKGTKIRPLFYVIAGAQNQALVRSSGKVRSIVVSRLVLARQSILFPAVLLDAEKLLFVIEQ